MTYITKTQLNDLFVDAPEGVTSANIVEGLVEQGHELEGYAEVAQQFEPKPARGLWERFKAGFGTKETREEAQALEEAEGRRGIGISDLPGDIVDVMGGVPSFITTSVGAALGAAAGAPTVVGAPVGAAAGAAAGYAAGEASRTVLGQLLGVREGVTPTEAVDVATDAVFVGGTWWAFGQGGKFLRPLSNKATIAMKDTMPNWLVKSAYKEADTYTASEFLTQKFKFTNRGMLKETVKKEKDLSNTIDTWINQKGIGDEKLLAIKSFDVAKKTQAAFKDSGETLTSILKIVEKNVPESKAFFAKRKWNLSSANKIRAELFDKTINTSTDFETKILREFNSHLEDEMFKRGDLFNLLKDTGVNWFKEQRNTILVRKAIEQKIAESAAPITSGDIFKHSLRLVFTSGGYWLSGPLGVVLPTVLPTVASPTGRRVTAQLMTKGTQQMLKAGKPISALLRQEAVEAPLSTYLKTGAVKEVAPHAKKATSKLAEWLGVK